MIRSQAELRQADHDRLDREYQAWIAAGNAPEVIARGVSGDNLTPRQRVNPPINRIEREAKKVHDAAVVPMRVKAGPAPWALKAGSKMEKTLRAVQAGNQRLNEIAEASGQSRLVVSNQLATLRSRGLIRSEGTKGPGAMVWLPCP